jgi:hypothetical protein
MYPHYCIINSSLHIYIYIYIVLYYYYIIVVFVSNNKGQNAHQLLVGFEVDRGAPGEEPN